MGYERGNASDPYWANYSALRGCGTTPARAESVSAVYACVSAISETIATLPLVLYRRDGDDGRERAKDHPLYRVLHDTPNGNQTALEFREQMQAAVLLKGNAYAEMRLERHAARPEPPLEQVRKITSNRGPRTARFPSRTRPQSKIS